MNNKVLALIGAELRLVVRNKTVAVASVILPVAFGTFWLFVLGGVAGPDVSYWGPTVALQLSLALAMGVYVTSTQTVVARRHHRVLKRMRTSGISDRGLLVATVAPSVVIALVQLLIFGVVNVLAGEPAPMDVVPMVLALLGGLALCISAALATAVVTPSPERAQITTLPLTLVLLLATVALAAAPLEGWWRALIAVPGAAVGQLVQLGLAGGTWSAGLGGLPAALPAVVALLVWPALFGVLARRRFRWDPRN